MQQRLQLGLGSLARWIEFGEEYSRYFLGLEKWLNDKKFIKFSLVVNQLCDSQYRTKN